MGPLLSAVNYDGNSDYTADHVPMDDDLPETATVAHITTGLVAKVYDDASKAGAG